MKISMIMAVGPNGEFGKDDHLPWKLKGDLAQFKEYTDSKPMIMSSATFASLPGKLPGRTHYVVGRAGTVAKNGSDPDYTLQPGTSLSDVIAFIEEVCPEVSEVCVIGGRKLLEEASLVCDSARITFVRETEEPMDANVFIDDEYIIDNLTHEMRVSCTVLSEPDYYVREWTK